MTNLSADQLRKLKSVGKAMTNSQGDPSFPIKARTGPDSLANAIKAVGRTRPNTPEQRAKVRRYIIGQASKNGWSADIPDSWNSDGTLKGGGS
jgi:hypothetical protein